MAAYVRNVSHAGPPCQYLFAAPMALSRRPRMASAVIACGVTPVVAEVTPAVAESVADAAVGVVALVAASEYPGRRRHSSGLCIVQAM